MRRTAPNRCVIAALLTLLLAAACTAWATERMAGESPTVADTEIIDDDLVIAGGQVTLAGEVTGDVLAAGGAVAISGPVGGDVNAAGGDVRLTGPIADDLRAVGGSVHIGGSVGDNAAVAGGEVRLEAGASVGRDADFAGGQVTIAGDIGRDLAVAGGEVRLSGAIGGNATVRAGRVELLSGAVVGGDLTVYASSPPVIAEDAEVRGNIEYHEAAKKKKGLAGAVAGFIITLVFEFLWLFVTGATLIAISRRWIDEVEGTMQTRPWASLGAGLATLVFTPVAAVLLLCTCIGLPLSLILMAMYFAALLFIGVFVAYRLGTWIAARVGGASVSPYARLAAGALLVGLVVALPWIGWLLHVGVASLGMGALVLQRRAQLARLRAQGEF